MNQLEITRKQIEAFCLMPGLIILMILGGMVGDNGVAYLAVAMECFMVFWILTGGRLSGVLGRMLHGRINKGQYKNAVKLRKNALLTECVVGAAGSLLMALLAVPLTRYVLKLPYSMALILILAPAIFFRTLSSVLLGYFQGEGTVLPTLISAIARQVGILIFGILFSKMFHGYGVKVSMLLKQDNFTAMYGGMGIALAIPVTEIVILLFLFLVYKGNKNRGGKINGGMRVTDDYGSQMRTMYGNMFPMMTAGLFHVLPLLLGMIFYLRICGLDADVVRYGIFYGKYLPLCALVILPFFSLLQGNCHRTASNLRKDEQRYARNYFWGGIHMGVVHALYWTVLAMILAPQFAHIVCKENSGLVEDMLRHGAVLIFFGVMSGYFTELLRQMGWKYLLFAVLLVYNIIFAVSALAMLNGGKGIMALVYAGIIAEGICMVAAGAINCYQIRCGIDWMRCLVLPAGAVCVAGLVTLFLGKAITPHLDSAVSVVVCAVIEALCYWGCLFLLQNFRRQDMNYLPGGNVIQRIDQLIRRR